MNSSLDTFSETLSYLYSLEREGIKLGLENIHLFLDSIGSPHLKYRTVIVAGTNGKGSTASMIAELARASGLKTGLYTSPHLVTVLERIKINSRNIDERGFIRCVERLRKLVQKSGPDFSLTHFEFLTSLAILHFQEEEVDLAVFEVGLGGRLDATNVIAPELSVIAEIDMDHGEFLGNTLEEITLEKCGIIREGGKTLLTSEKKKVVELVEKNCMERGAKLYRFGREYNAKLSPSGKRSHRIDFRNFRGELPYIPINLYGNHQIKNSATAIQAMDLLTDGKLDRGCIEEAFEGLHLEGRVEVINRASRRFILDIAHNPNAAECLKKTLAGEFKYESLILIAGIMADKEVESILKVLVPVARVTILTVPKTERAASLSSLMPIIARLSKNSVSAPGVGEAIGRAIALTSPHDLIVITGSCFTVGEAKEYLACPLPG